MEECKGNLMGRRLSHQIVKRLIFLQSLQALPPPMYTPPPPPPPFKILGGWIQRTVVWLCTNYVCQYNTPLNLTAQFLSSVFILTALRLWSKSNLLRRPLQDCISKKIIFSRLWIFPKMELLPSFWLKHIKS